MNTGGKNVILNIIESILRIGAIFILGITFVMMLIAMFDRNNKDEASIGSFEAWDFNEGWLLSGDEGNRRVDLPLTLEKESGEMITIVNTLPEDLTDGMSLMIRTAMEDVEIYVDGHLREKYATESIRGMSYYIPSAYVVAALSGEDAGKEIRIVLTVKIRGVVNGITYGYGNNVWYPVIKNGLAVNMIAAVVLVLGLLLCAAVLFFGRTLRISTVYTLGLLMVNVALWVFSESTLRQFFFRRPSLSQYFAFLTVELIAALSCMYFDEVQHRVYHRRYLIAECIVSAQIVINILLHVSGILPFYRTMTISHVWTGLCAVIAISCIVTDIIRKRIREYLITLIGMICFVIFSLGELLGYYINRFHVFGSMLCVALILLMVATIVQMIYDAVRSNHIRERKQTTMTINTIETIAGAIDARDEYTGGHSERVSLYASRLAREMAADYDLSEEDILRVQYIGLVHDIGKIGVADSVLNKSGRLTDEEFGLMKKHAEIGYEIMSSLSDSIDGLLDGIRHHHERFDGKGYPDGLSDTDIPLVARILALADSYDAMTSNRVYRKRLSDSEVREELLRCAGTQFDPALTEIFVRLIDRGELNPNTVDGAAADETGRVRKSSVLENRLQKDLLQNENIINPSHIRMLCYVMKLMEKKGKDYLVYFVEMKKDVKDDLSETLRKVTGVHDINIRYTEDSRIIAFYDKDPEEAQEVLSVLRTMEGVTVSAL